MIATTQIKRNENGDPAVVPRNRVMYGGTVCSHGGPLGSGFTSNPVDFAISNTGRGIQRRRNARRMQSGNFQVFRLAYVAIKVRAMGTLEADRIAVGYESVI